MCVCVFAMVIKKRRTQSIELWKCDYGIRNDQFRLNATSLNAQCWLGERKKNSIWPDVRLWLRFEWPLHIQFTCNIGRRNDNDKKNHTEFPTYLVRTWCSMWFEIIKRIANNTTVTRFIRHNNNTNCNIFTLDVARIHNFVLHYKFDTKISISLGILRIHRTK